MLLRSLPLPLYLLALLSLSLYVTGADVRITTAQGLIDLSEKVLLGTTYADTTIFLENDIDFSGVSGNFKPIGDENNDFRGVFDGQGYKISNLKLNSGTFRHAGFFGFSNGGIAVRNLVLDNTCSFSSSKDTTNTKNNAFVGGIIGCCDSTYGVCISENNVNMAGVSFAGTSGNNMYIGGIVGMFCPGDYGYDVTIRNCVNYGAITFSGTTSNGLCYVGGVVGDLTRSTNSQTTKYIQNCINYGTVSSSGTIKDNTPYMGGVIGVSSNPVVVESCVNVGQVKTPTSPLLDTHIGSVVGYAFRGGVITHCHWVSGTGYDKLYGSHYEISGETLTETGNSQITIDAASVSTLNSYRSGNKWVYNTNSASVTFHTNGGGGYTIASEKLILLPSLVEGSGRKFSGWYTDINCTNKFDANTISVSGNVDLYGGWKYTVSLNGNGGVTSQPTKDVVYGQHYGTLPGATRTGYTFLGWYTASSGGTKVESNTTVTITSDRALYAQWTIATYTVTFDGNGGTPSRPTMTFIHGGNYEALPDVERAGYTFLGWYTNVSESSSKVERGDKLSILNDHTLYALWEANIYVVTFDGNDGILSQDSKNVTYDEPYGEFPEATREGHTFIGWYTNVTDGDEIESETKMTTSDDHTLYARWTINNYTVTFKIDNGTAIEKVFPFNATIEYPENPEKEGFMFNGWDKTIELMPANNVTISVLWNETTQYVEIVFGTKDMSKEQIEQIIKEIINDEDTDFIIERFDVDEQTGETRVIIKFNDKEKANDFIRSAQANEGGLVIRVGFTTFDENSQAFSFHGLLPTVFLHLIL